MNYQDKTKEELIQELVLLKAEIQRLSTSRKSSTPKTDDIYQSELRYERFFEDNHSVMLLINPQTGAVIDVNPAATQYYGWTRGEMQNMHISDINTLSPDEVKAEMQKSITDKRRQFHFKHRLANGEVKNVEVYSGPIKFGNSTYLYSIVHDISETSKAIENLRMSEEKYRNIFETVQDVYYEASPYGILLDVSPAIETISKGQFTREEAIGKSFVNLYAEPEARNRVLNQLMTEGKVIDYELLLLNKDGSVVPVSISSTVIKDKDGNPVKITGSMRDISERKKAEKELQESKALYQSIVNASPDDITIADLQGTVLYVSPKAISMFRYEHENEIIGRNLMEFIAPQDIEKAIIRTQNMLLGNPIGTTEYKALRGDGTIFDVEVNGEFIRDNEGNPIKVVYIVRDVSYRKQIESIVLESEKQYRTLADTGHALIWTATPDKKCNYFNQVWLDFTGRTIEQELGDGWAEGVHPEDLNRCIDIYITAFDKREEFSMTYRIRRFDGEYRWVLDNGKPRYDTHGEFIGYIGHCLDITERILAEEELKESEEKYRKDLLLLNSIFESPVNIIVFSLDTSYCYTAFTKYHAQTIKQIWGVDIQLGMNMLDIITNKDDYKKAKQNFDRVLKGEYFVLTEEYGDDALYRTYFEDFYSPVKNNLGEIIGISVFVIDISERMKATKKLEISEEKYRKDLLLLNSIFESPVNIIVYSLDKNYCYSAFTKYHAQTMKKIWGIDIQVGMNMIEQMSNIEIREKYTSTFDRAFKGESFILNDEHNDKQFGRTYYESFYSPVKNSLGQITGVSVFVVDITDRMQATKRLEISEDKFRQVVEQTSDFIAITDNAGNITYASSSSVSIFHLQPEEMVGQNFIQFVAESSLGHSSNGFRKIVESDAVLTNSVSKMKRATGEEFYGELNGSRYTSESVNGVLVTIKDITERKNAEKEILKFKTIADQANYGVVLASLKGEFLYVNDAFAKMVGWEADDLIGKNSSVVHNEEQAERVAEIISLMKSNKGFTSEELYHTRKDGSSFPTQMSSKVIFDENNVFQYLSATIIDISDRKIAEEKINKLDRLKTVTSNINEAIITEKNKESLLQKVCNIAIDSGKFQMAWIGQVEENSNLVKPFIHAGFENGYLSHIKPISIDKNAPESHGPTGTALREKRLYVTNDIENDPVMALWKDEAIQRNYRSSIAFPLMQFDKIYGSFNIYSSQINFFNEEETELLVGVVNNISYALAAIESEHERKRVETDLLKISQAVEQSPVMTIITGIEGKIQYANPALTKLTGYTKEELIGQNPNVLSSHEKTKHEYHELWKTITSGKQWKGEFHNKKKNGELYWAGALISPIIDSKGKITHYVSVEEDITQRKLIEKELIELNESLELKVEERTRQLNEAKRKLENDIQKRILIEKDLRWNKSLLELMSNSSPLGFLVVDNRTDEILYFNSRFCSIWGIQQLEVEMKRGELKNNDIIPYCLPVLADIPAFAESCKPLQFEDNRIIVEDEIPFINNRTVRRFSTQIRGENDEYYGRFYIFEDITDRKQAEFALLESREIFSSFMDYLPAVVFIKDQEGRTLFVNKFMDNAFGALQWVGKTMLEMFPGELGQKFLADDLNSLKIGYQRIEESLYQLDGELHEYETQKFVINRTGREPLLGGIALDITERKKIEEESRDARMEAEKANLAKSEFLSRMSHELRTPMNSILGFAQLLELSNLNTGQQKGVSHILKSGKHLLDLINEVLDISRIEAGRLSFDYETLDVRTLVQETIESIRPLAVENLITLKNEIGNESLIEISSDKQRLRQILLNLLNNAVKYNRKKGSVTIQVVVKNQQNPKLSTIKFSVIDTGLGLSEENQQKLFTPFERAGADKSSSEGTGLGLSIVKKLVEAMNGKIGLQSKVGVGSTFWFELPILQSNKANIGIKSDGSYENVTKHSGGASILYIEDNQENIELIADILETQRPNVNLITSYYGKETVGLAKKHQPDLILLDVNLPDMNGLEVLNSLQMDQKTSTIPVIILSADAMESQIQKLLKAGARDYITKPIDIKSFITIVDGLTQNT
ncbi:MAG: PAS domain S-box protein [Bacteroidales bacterium]